jgi:hypothetical protein
VLRGQRRDALLHQRSVFAAFGGFIGQRLVGGQLTQSVCWFALVVFRKGREGQGTLLADGIAVTVEQNRAEPGEELATAIVAGVPAYQIRK